MTSLGNSQDFVKNDLCYACKSFARLPHLVNCPIADKIIRLSNKHNILLATFSCPKFEPMKVMEEK